MIRYPKKLFVTGTDTDIGKTVISSILVSGLKAEYWKPIQAGRDPITDTQFLKNTTGLPENYFHDESFNLTEPMSPHAAAEIDGVSIHFDNIHEPDMNTDHLVIEGAGGLIVPINGSQYVIDLIVHFGYPALLVAKSGLGTLNHTLLSLEAMTKRDIPVFGVVMVGDRHHSNEEAIIKYGNVKRLFRIPTLPDLTQKTVHAAFHSYLKEPIYTAS